MCNYSITPEKAEQYETIRNWLYNEQIAPGYTLIYDLLFWIDKCYTDLYNLLFDDNNGKVRNVTEGREKEIAHVLCYILEELMYSLNGVIVQSDIKSCLDAIMKCIYK
ncbi:MAG: hypothetical protein IJ848_01185 [Alphaproteobacteria bacterium]|nr:hypothetical protein [Alphaproteobacteria bacterium]